MRGIVRGGKNEGSSTTDATASAADILSGETAYIATGKVTGVGGSGGFEGTAVVDTGYSVAAGDRLKFVADKARPSSNWDAITHKAKTLVNSAAISGCRNVALDATRTLYLYTGKARVITRGLTKAAPLTIGAEQTLATMTSVGYACLIGTNKVFVTFQNGSGYAAGVVLTITGDTVTAGTVLALNAVNATQMKCAALGTDKVAVVYHEYSTHKPTLVICTISGTTITKGSAYYPNTAGSVCWGIDIIALSTSLIVMSYCTGSSAYQYMRAASISGTTPTFGTEVAFTVSMCGNAPRMAKISATRFAYTKCENSSTSLYSMNIATVSGTTITTAVQTVQMSYAHSPDDMTAYVLALDTNTLLYLFNWAGHNIWAYMFTGASGTLAMVGTTYMDFSNQYATATANQFDACLANGRYVQLAYQASTGYSSYDYTGLLEGLPEVQAIAKSAGASDATIDVFIL